MRTAIALALVPGTLAVALASAHDALTGKRARLHEKAGGTPNAAHTFSVSNGGTR